MLRFFTLPPQIFRLILLIFAIVISYLAARTLLTPSSFYDYGFYRADALVEHAGHPTVFAGKVACGVRHPDILKTLDKGGHKSLSCEACHGVVSKDQLDHPERKLNKPTEAVCVRCHEANPSRPAWFHQIEIKDHYDDKCLDCHLPHEPSEFK